MIAFVPVCHSGSRDITCLTLLARLVGQCPISAVAMIDLDRGSTSKSLQLPARRWSDEFKGSLSDCFLWPSGCNTGWISAQVGFQP